jgi:hypothetical protein
MESLGVEYLRQRGHALSRALFLRLDEYVDDFPTGTPVTLVRFFKAIAEESDKTIAATSDPQRLTLICQILSDIIDYSMSLLDHAHTAQTPRGLAHIMEQFREHFHPESTLLIAPISEYNYTIEDELPRLANALRNTLVLAARFEELSQCFEKRFFVVRFPRVERENILLHAILGHEVGHPIAADYLRQDRAAADYDAMVRLLKRRIQEEYRSELRTEPNKIERKAQLFDECINHRVRGIEELVSDVVAVALFGVSALFAAAEILIPDGLDVVPQEPEFYPPVRMRLRVMCQALERTNHLQALKRMSVGKSVAPHYRALLAHIRKIERVAGLKTDIAALSQYPLARIAYEQVHASLDPASEFALQKANVLAYTPQVMTSELPEALERMSLGLPPGERGMFPRVIPVDWRTPILVGWARKLYLCEQKKMGWDKRRDEISKVQSRALKGVEDALLRKEYGQEFPHAMEK